MASSPRSLASRVIFLSVLFGFLDIVTFAGKGFWALDCYSSWNAIAYARLFRTISRNLKLKRKGKGKGSPELHHPNSGAISGAGGVGWQNVPVGPGRIGRCVRHDGQAAVTVALNLIKEFTHIVNVTYPKYKRN